jgi:hypothetical protein
MHIKAIKEGLVMAENALQTLRKALEKLSDDKQRKDLEKMLQEAEAKLKEAEARIAHELGFPICRHCWPPEIMIYSDQGEYICRNCGKSMPDGISMDISNLDDLSTW